MSSRKISTQIISAHSLEKKVIKIKEKWAGWMRKSANGWNWKISSMKLRLKKKQIKIMESEHFNNLDLKKQWLSITNRLNQVEESVSETVVKVEGILHSGLGRWFSGFSGICHTSMGTWIQIPTSLKNWVAKHTIAILVMEMAGDRQIPGDPGEWTRPHQWASGSVRHHVFKIRWWAS